MEKSYISIKEASKRYPISVRALYLMCSSKSKYTEFRDKCVGRLGKKILINVEEFNKYIEGN